MTATTELDQPVRLRTQLEAAARTLARFTLIGMLLGIFVVGVLSRLAMFLLAELNPIAAGTMSDDGFPIGQFTLSGSLNLMFLVGAPLGILGAGLYVAARGLMIGPAWFRLASISLGPGLVIGALLVHTDGVDFTRLDPPLLSAALFVAIPTLYVALLHLGAGVFAARELPRPLVVLALVPWVVPYLPVGLALLGGFLVRRRLRATQAGRRLLERAWPAWVARAVLAALVVWAVLNLRSDLAFLTPG